MWEKKSATYSEINACQPPEGKPSWVLRERMAGAGRAERGGRARPPSLGRAWKSMIAWQGQRQKQNLSGGRGARGMVDVGRGTGELGTWLAGEKRPVWGDRGKGLGNWPMDGKPNRPWPLENAGWMVSHN